MCRTVMCCPLFCTKTYAQLNEKNNTHPQQQPTYAGKTSNECAFSYVHAGSLTRKFYCENYIEFTRERNWSISV